MRLLSLLAIVCSAQSILAFEPIPDRLIVLTFDDASRSHFTVARPLLLKHKMGATFFVTEGWDFASNKKDYMTWEQIAQLHKDGFEIGNHTLDHMAINQKTLRDLSAQLKGIDLQCKKYGIPKPVSFAYPGNAILVEALPILKDHGIRFARRGGSPEFEYKSGGGIAYEPGLDHPLLIPTTGDARPDWTLENVKKVVQQAQQGRIAVMQFHGVPDTAHDWVSTTQTNFESIVDYLANEKCTVIALRDLARYVNSSIEPKDPHGVIDDRIAQLKSGRLNYGERKSTNEEDLKYWLTSAIVHHGYSESETGAALGMTTELVRREADRLGVSKKNGPDREFSILPYPGGRHPRTGFLDGAIRPQRETKVSVFPPWSDGGYAVVDVPEAVWFEPAPKKSELLYLAHTHIPTYWDRQKQQLKPLEWERRSDGSLELERTLPNNVKLKAVVKPRADGCDMTFCVRNGTDQTLTGLRVQMCVMLAGLKGFESHDSKPHRLESPFATCRDKDAKRWIITAWEHSGRVWGNPPCPCIHSDPVVPNCPPGESREVRGGVWFHEGADPAPKLKQLRIEHFSKDR